MATIDKFLQDDLIKFGILDQNGVLNSKIPQKDYDNLINGGGLLIEKSKKAVLLTASNSKLSYEVFNNDQLKHKNLSSAELLRLSHEKQGALFKTFADYGKIIDFGKDNYLGDKRNEKQFFVVLQNERGESVFWGNELEKKLEHYKIGDKVQINNTGIEAKQIDFTFNDQKETATKYDNQFAVSDFNPNNKQYKSSLFEINPLTKIVKELDVSQIAIKSVNGQYLSENDIDKLRKGKTLSLENGLEIKLSPNSQNKNGLLANTPKLLIGSLILDGGMSFAIITSIQLIRKLLDEKQKQQVQNKYFNELQNLKGFLQQQLQRYPDDKRIINNINIVDKEIGSVNSVDTDLNKKANYSEARLDIKDFDVSKDIQEKADLKREQEQREDRGFGMNR